MFFKKIFKKKEQLDTELENIKQDEKIMNSIVSVEKLNKKFQKSREEIIVEKNKITLCKRDALVNELVKGIINQSRKGNNMYSKQVHPISCDGLYREYGLCLNDELKPSDDGKNWILSLIDSFKSKGYYIELKEKIDYQGLIRGVRIIIRW